ncbi:MAG: phosphotransferase family protein [Actinomycetota bacterium]|nr:phosphotransferase family protein [Actinomycetota bacterium]
MSVALDLVALRELLGANGVEVVGDLSAILIAGGRSNLTYKVSDDRSSWVARRPPRSGLTPSAHDVAREFRVTRALQGTPVPVARTVALDADGSVLGTPVSVVDFVAGTAIRSQDDLAQLTDGQIGHAVDSLVRCLVELHAVDPTEVGLAHFRRPAGFLARQVNRWSQQWQRVRRHDRPDVDRLAALLSDRVPAGGDAAVLHGDFRIDNTLLDLGCVRPVRAVVDWEMSTLGDPLTDVALMCVYRSPAFDAVLGATAAWTSPRLPGAESLAESYARRSGRDLGDWDFYLGLAYFKLAVIAEGITHRARSGTGSDPTAEGAADAVPALVADGLAALRPARRA